MRKLLILVFLILIAVKAIAIIALGPVPIQRDALGYWRLSTLVMGGDWLMLAEPIAYRTPGYPWFLALVRSLSGPYSLPAIVVAQAALMVASVWLGGRIAVRVTRLPRAMVWTLIVALPAVSAWIFAAALLSESLFVFLFMLHLLAVLQYDERPTASRALWAGLTFGMALLTRPVILLLWTVHVPFLLWSHWRRRGSVGNETPVRVSLSARLGHAVAAALLVMAMVAPWIARNTILFEQPFLTQFVGRNLWVVTFQDGSGAGLPLPESAAGEQLQSRITRMGTIDDWRLTWSVSNALVESGLNDAQADALMQRVALDAIDLDRSLFRDRALRRIVNFWRVSAAELPSQAVTGSYRGQLTWKYNVPVVEWAIEHRLSGQVWVNTLLAALTLLALFVLFFNRPSRPHALWLLLILAYFAVITGLFEIPAYRYRIVIEPLLTAVGGASIAILFSRRRKSAAVVPQA